jgi:hypothetical protein
MNLSVLNNYLHNVQQSICIYTILTNTYKNKQTNKNKKKQITYRNTISVANVTLKITCTHPDTVQKRVFVPLFKLNYVCAKV